MKRAVILALAAGLLAARGARADVLYLQGGGSIQADRWWIEGETLHVESSNGSVGLPRTMLLRVEPTAVKPRDPAARRKGAASSLREPIATPPPSKAPSPETTGKMKEANAALTAREFDRAALLYYELVEAEPEAPGPRVGYALAEMARGRDAMALPVVLDGITRDPDVAELHEVLGSLRDREERVEDALSEWREAFRLAPTDRVRDKVMKAERELAAARNYEFSPAAHFTLRYDGALDQDLVAALTDFLEDSFHSQTLLYRHAPSQPITVLLYPQQEFHDVTQVGSEVAGLYDGKIRVPLGGLKRLTSEARRVLIHELTHAIVQSKTRGNCPRWLHEGLAQIAESRALRRADLAALAREVRADDPATWPDKAFNYPAALSFTRFLEARQGFDVLVTVLDRLSDGETPESALSATYSATYAQLAEAWAESLRAEAGP